MGQDYYKVLGIDKTASEDDVKKAYKKMVGFYRCGYQIGYLADSLSPLWRVGSKMASRP